MIDFLKILVRDKDLIEQFNTNPLLVWHDKKETLSHYDFEVIHTKETKIYHGILFCFYERKLEILFKPHYYFNQNKHNANDFTALDCIAVLLEFVEIFEIWDFEKYPIKNIEFGLNLKSPIAIKDLISFIQYHYKNEFGKIKGLQWFKMAGSTNKTGNLNKYKIIKAYAKGLQFPEIADKDLFRFEVKSKERKYINPLGITYISDLLNPTIYERLALELQKEFAEVLILDNNTTFANLNKKEKRKLEKYLNPIHWDGILQKNRNTFVNNKKQYFRLLDKTENNIHTTLKNLIGKKLEILKNCAISTPLPKKKNCAISTININGNCTKKPFAKQRICPITKTDISMQKEDSFLLSNTGLKVLEKTDPKKFDFLKQTLLTGNFNRFEKNTYSKISKQIRNKYFNNPSKYYNRQPQLF